MDCEYDRVSNLLSGLAVNDAVRSKVASDLYGEIEDATMELGSVISTHLFERIRLFVAEWKNAKRVLNSIGWSARFEDLVFEERDRESITDLTTLIKEADGKRQDTPSSPPPAWQDPDWICPGGVMDDVLKSLRRGYGKGWMTVAELAVDTLRAQSSVYSKRCLGELLHMGLIEEQRRLSANGRLVRSFRILIEDEE